MALVVIEAIKLRTAPKPLEYAGLATGMFGALIFVIPNVFTYILCFCCLDKFLDDEEGGENEQNEDEKAKPLMEISNKRNTEATTRGATNELKESKNGKNE